MPKYLFTSLFLCHCKLSI